MSEGCSDSGAADSGDDADSDEGSYGGGSGDEADKDLLIECGQRQVRLVLVVILHLSEAA